MKVIALSKRAFDKTMTLYGITDENVKDMKSKYFISINETVGTDETPWFKSNHPNVLVQRFDDVLMQMKAMTLDGKDNYVNPISEDQAKQMADFIKKIPTDATVLVHCAAGVSRSGAVVTAIAEHFNLPKDEFEMLNPHISPNNRVLAYLRKNLQPEA